MMKKIWDWITGNVATAGVLIGALFAGLIAGYALWADGYVELPVPGTQTSLRVSKLSWVDAKTADKNGAGYSCAVVCKREGRIPAFGGSWMNDNKEKREPYEVCAAKIPNGGDYRPGFIAGKHAGGCAVFSGGRAGGGEMSEDFKCLCSGAMKVEVKR